jgi:hypothetical protein
MVAPTPVVTKFDLLSGPDLKLLDSMAWDQQAEVDYYVLLKSSQFLGMSNSTFSWSVADARKSVSKAGTCGYRDESVGANLEQGLSMQDELTVIIGHLPEFKFWSTLWP